MKNGDRFGNRLNVCDTKTMYDTEFAAEIAASKIGHKYGEDMYHYACQRPGVSLPHFHIAHKSKRERRGAGYNYVKCQECGLLMKKSTFQEGRHVCSKKENRVQLTP